MTNGSADRDTLQIEALETDRYLDSLLTAHSRGTDHIVKSSTTNPLHAVAGRLARDLPRYHPSFRFEEALSGRLAQVALAMRVRSVEQPTVVPFPIAPGELAPAWVGAFARPARPVLGRPWVIGGAVTSAALSLAGAAYVAWRRGRTSRGSRLI